ncbi:MAG: helix-turn-helix transcriptional regulator [Ktedonobacterales bacterium]
MATLLCPIMIGRAQPSAVLSRYLELADTGHGHTLLIAGEAGIGKSRFATEAKVRAHARGMQAAQGNCFESDRAVPYAPLIDLLRDLLSNRSSSGIAELLGTAAPELVKLSPEVNARLPGVVPAPTATPEQEKRRLFHALTQTLIQVAQDRPLLLVIEDIHWCDDNTLDFLLSWARLTATYPVLVMLTFRSDEIQDSLSRFLATMARLRIATEIELERLNASEVDEMLRAMFALPGPIQVEFLHQLYGLSEGNPFFTEEIINALIASGEITITSGRWDPKPTNEIRLPRSIRDAVLRRSKQLSSSAHDLLALAAVAGRRFDFTLLEALTGHDEAQLVHLIKELLGAQLVVEESADEFAFRHALTQQVIYLDLLARERASLHRAIAYQMEQEFAPTLEGHLADLARHFYEAGAWAKALEYASRAGAKAQTLYAPRAAVEHFTHALAAAQRLGQSSSHELLQARGQAYELLGDFTHAQADFEDALAEADLEQDMVAKWNALVCLGMLWAGRDYQKTGEYYRQAFALAETVADQTLLAHSLNRIGNWYVNHEEPIEAQRHHQQALTLMEASDDQSGIAETCDFLGMAYLLGSDLIQSARYYQRSITLLRKTDQRPVLSSSLATLGICTLAYQCSILIPSLSLSASQGYCEEALRIAHAIGYRPGEAYAYFCLGCVLGPQGKWDAALKAMQNSLAIAEEIEHQQWMCAALTGLNCLYDDLLDFDSARRYGERALEIARALDSKHWIHCATGHLASACIHEGDLVRAAAVLQEVGMTSTSVTSLGEHLLASALVELLLAQEDKNGAGKHALGAVQNLIAHTPNSTSNQLAPRLALLYGKALAANGQPAEAEVMWQAGVASAQKANASAILWMFYADLAHIYRRERRQNEAAHMADEGSRVVHRLAEDLSDSGMRSRFLKAAMAILPSVPIISARQGAKQHYSGLTKRECEVAQFIAQGKSNKSIAEAMIVSERTIESHVSNILSKLGFTARAQVAVWVVEQGLTLNHPV